MDSVRCDVVRWVADSPQPGWVEAHLTDANGRRWLFFDKPPIFGAGIDRSSKFPVPASIRCEVLSDGEDREEAVVEIRLLDGVEAQDGTARFLVPADQIDRG